MLRRTGMTWVLAASTICLSACGRVHEPGEISPPTTKPTPAGGVQQITIHVPDMIGRQGIT
jgi:hypothetical protein